MELPAKQSERLLRELIAAYQQYRLRTPTGDQEIRYLKRQLERTTQLVIGLHNRLARLEDPTAPSLLSPAAMEAEMPEAIG